MIRFSQYVSRLWIPTLASVLLFAVPAFTASAQDTPVAKQAAKAESPIPKIPEIDKIVTPVSPAFVILGISPTSIERPSTPSKFAISLANAFTSGSQAQLPRTYALEVAPFWLASHPRLRAWMLEDAAGRTDPLRTTPVSKVLQNILHTFVLGVASADSAFKTTGPQPADTSVFRLGMSVRASLLRGHWADGCLASIERPLTDLATRIAGPLAEWIARNPNATNEELAAEKTRIERQVTADVNDPSGDCFSAYYGWSLDVAAATVDRFPAQSFDGGQLAAHAWWVTFGYKDKLSRSLLAVARVGREGAKGKRLGSRYTDVGARVLLPQKEWAFSLEGVRRRLVEPDSTSNLWRFTGGFDYKVSEGLWINSSFGRDYQAKRANSLVALLGLKWNLGTKSLAAEQKK